MEERFNDEFVTWHHKTPVGIKVDEVFGMDSRSGKVWMELARQIYCEQGEPNYRVIDHFSNGAPFLQGSQSRISITHTTHFFAVASLPRTPESDLAVFSPRTAMGIDTEPLDRSQVVKLRERFLSEEELKLIPAEDVVENVKAWTAKEALYKAAMTPGLDFRKSIRLLSLPAFDQSPSKGEPRLGEAILEFPQETGIAPQPMKLYSYESYGCCVTIAFSPKCAKFGK